MLLFSALLVSLGQPSSDVPYVFRTMAVSPALREVRFSGGKRGRYFVRGDQARERVTGAAPLDVDALTAALMLPELQTPEQAAELVDTLETPLSAARAKSVLQELGAKVPAALEPGQGATDGGLWVERLYARTTAAGGGALVKSRFTFGPKPSRTDVVLLSVEPRVAPVPSAPPPPPSKEVDAFWRAVRSAP